jgi:hypothetical protein
LLAASGQHLDLLGHQGTTSPEQVLAMQRAKTSSVALVAECGALLGGCSEENRARYRTIGEKLTLVVQIVDDLRDIYGKDNSPDLSTGKMTYPLACFLEKTSKAEQETLVGLVEELPESLPTLRKLLLQQGVVADCAVTVDRLRAEIHHEMARTENQAAEQRLLLSVVDNLAASLYETQPVAETAHLWRPTGEFNDQVRRAWSELISRLAPLGLSDPPTITPWHLPHYMYEPSCRTIHYPDLDGLPDEILPFQAELLATRDEEAITQTLTNQMPAVLAHEMFHFWRDATGRLTEDSWHEEYVANRLAVGYLRLYAPDLLQAAQRIARSVVARFSTLIDHPAEQILDRCQSPGPASGYEMDMKKVAIVQLEMVLRLAEQQPDLVADVRRFLTPDNTVTAA